VSGLYIRKQGLYTENRIFPFAEISDLKSSVFIKIRKLAANQKPNHPWKSMDDFKLLKSAGLYLKDLQSDYLD
jgi:ATP-dependent DNA helicase RecG